MQYLSDSLDRCSMFKEELHHFRSVLLAGNVKRSETILHKEGIKRSVGIYTVSILHTLTKTQTL